MTDNNEPYERKDFNDFLVGDSVLDDSPEYHARLADQSEWMRNFDFSDMMLD